MKKYSLRKSKQSDIPALCELAEAARRFMAEHGNARQWGDGYPRAADFNSDIAKGASFVCEDEQGNIIGTCALFDYEPCYEVIRAGNWLNDKPYVVLHRVAAYAGQGVGTFMLQTMQQRWDNIRIDTMAENLPMRSLLSKRGFKYCGIIEIAGRGDRVAYQWTRHVAAN